MELALYLCPMHSKDNCKQLQNNYKTTETVSQGTTKNNSILFHSMTLVTTTVIAV